MVVVWVVSVAKVEVERSHIIRIASVVARISLPTYVNERTGESTREEKRIDSNRKRRKESKRRTPEAIRFESLKEAGRQDSRELKKIDSNIQLKVSAKYLFRMPS